MNMWDDLETWTQSSEISISEVFLFGFNKFAQKKHSYPTSLPLVYVPCGMIETYGNVRMKITVSLW
jgi:hypothetical protein